MTSNLPVYVGVDGSVTAVEAADVAAGEAAARGTELVILHVGEPDNRALESALARVRLRYPQVVQSIRYLCTGQGTARALAEHSADGCLMVVGHRGRSVRRGTLAGSVAQDLVGIATVPTIVYRALDLTRDVPEPRPVLVGVSPHRIPDAVLEFALSQASRRRAELDIICASPEHDGEPGLAPDVAESVHSWLDKYPDVVSRLHIRPGIDPAIALMVDSHSAQLVVVGTGARSANQSGSIAHALVHRAACPVAVIPRASDRQPRGQQV
jgi:nucleotide-binding universal stress UspA family protein